MKTFAFVRKIVHNYQNPHQNYHYCGYVGIIDDSKIPLSIQASNDLCDKEALDFKIEVHGGITFDRKLMLLHLLYHLLKYHKIGISIVALDLILPTAMIYKIISIQIITFVYPKPFV